MFGKILWKPDAHKTLTGSFRCDIKIDEPLMKRVLKDAPLPQQSQKDIERCEDMIRTILSQELGINTRYIHVDCKGIEYREVKFEVVER